VRSTRHPQDGTLTANRFSPLVQNISAADQEVILKALDLVRQALEQIDEIAGVTHAELLEVVTDLRGEVTKPVSG
jgi:hypothetical protein